MVFSKSRVLIVVVFILLQLIYRFYLPFGDEPDFETRLNELSSFELPIWMPYYWFNNAIANFELNTICSIDNEPLSLWVQMGKNFDCYENAVQVITRFILTVIVCLPLLILLIFKNYLSAFFLKNITSNEYENRLDAVSLSLLIPGMIYYLGLLSLEQLTLVISLCVYLFLNSWFVFPLLWIMANIDPGNTTVVVAFLFFNWVVTYIFNNKGIRYAFLFLISSIVIAYLIENNLLLLLQEIPIFSSKASSMLLEASLNSFREKYPIFLRPIVTFMSAIFLTPSGVKVIFLYLYVGSGFIYFLYQYLIIRFNSLCSINRFKLDEKMLPIFSSIAFIYIMALMFPNYVNAKYYIFLAPNFLYSASAFFRRKHLIVFWLICSVQVPFWLFLFAL